MHTARAAGITTLVFRPTRTSPSTPWPPLSVSLGLPLDCTVKVRRSHQKVALPPLYHSKLLQLHPSRPTLFASREFQATYTASSCDLRPPFPKRSSTRAVEIEGSCARRIVDTNVNKLMFLFENSRKGGPTCDLLLRPSSFGLGGWCRPVRRIHRLAGFLRAVDRCHR